MDIISVLQILNLRFDEIKNVHNVTDLIRDRLGV